MPVECRLLQSKKTKEEDLNTITRKIFRNNNLDSSAIVPSLSVRTLKSSVKIQQIFQGQIRTVNCSCVMKCFNVCLSN